MGQRHREHEGAVTALWRGHVPPGIFGISDGMGLVSKRVEHVPHSEPPKVKIRSINPEYQPYERDAEEVHVLGRVIWAARRL